MKMNNISEEQIEKIKVSLNKLKNKESKFLFPVPEATNPAASVYEVYFHAYVVSKMGYDVYMLTEKGDYEIPNWIESKLTDLKHMSLSDPKLMVGPEDFMIIPEVYSNIMEQTKNLPCKRISLLQSIDYMMNALIPGTDWTSFNINDVITTSESLKELLEIYYGNKYNVKTYNIGIPEYFEKSDKLKKPIISIIGRNPNEISKFVKLFYAKYPQYSWITFDPMLTKSKPAKQMRRLDFAKRLQENFAAVWVDRIASFGTFPLECMRTGTIPICLKPDILPEYMLDRDGEEVTVHNDLGLWTENFYDLPILTANALVKFLDDSISDEFYDKMYEISSKYNQGNSENELTVIYGEYINNRIEFFENAIKNDEE